jgi:hypothetical protein
MATNRAMLKEAIADAKAVKETAIANAKAALEEAFTPQLKSMLSMKLQEMDLEEDNFEEAYMSKKDKDLEEMYDKEETNEEVDLEELLAELGKEDEVEEGLYEAEETEEEEISDEEETEDEGEPIDLEDMTDDDLKSMIEDVIADMIKSGELEAGHEGEEEEGESEEVEVEDEEEVDLAELLREIEGLEEESETEDLEGEDKRIEDAFKNINEIQLNEYTPFPTATEWAPILAAIGGLLSSGYALNTLKSYINKKASEGSKKFQKIKNALAKLGDIASSAYKGSKGLEEETEPTKELEEAYSTIKTLKSELNEINLLNAKLLYTNKIFKSKTLNENQKVKVLSSFDKAKNVGEVKMVFETLNEGIKVSKNTINENLGRASKGTMTPNVKKPIVESNEAFLRMQKLAGII